MRMLAWVRSLAQLMTWCFYFSRRTTIQFELSMQQLLPERGEVELSDLLRKKKKNVNGIHRIHNEIVEQNTCDFDSNRFYTIYVRRYPM